MIAPSVCRVLAGVLAMLSLSWPVAPAADEEALPALRAAYRQPQLGWDGSGAELVAQVLAPLTLAHEMGNRSLDQVLARIRADAGLADGRFHNLGISFFGEPSEDLGRYHVTGRSADQKGASPSMVVL